MVVDGRGNSYVGNFGFDMESGERPKAAALSLVVPTVPPRLPPKTSGSRTVRLLRPTALL